jgi:hypothetical protein
MPLTSESLVFKSFSSRMFYMQTRKDWNKQQVILLFFRMSVQFSLL